MTTRYVRDWNAGFRFGLLVGMACGGGIFAMTFALLCALGA